MVRSNNYRYLGNKNKMEVHDQDNDDTKLNGCQNDEKIGAGYNVRITPDTLELAYKEGYENCDKC